VQSIVASMPRSAGMSIATAGSWPVLDTYAAPLDLVLRNLIANAVTHHDRPADGHIVVTGRSSTDWLEISIADDGPGIAPEWHETIFQPFKTVGTSADTERSGIGLALVRRTLETVGGQLTLSSDPAVGRGATFTIKWPVLIAA
jgi:signal transduction histidine kinase